jgi:hypothetical protein
MTHSEECVMFKAMFENVVEIIFFKIIFFSL